MIKSIGLIDFDVLSQQKYIAPNYDLGLTYAYLKQDPNILVRLVSSFNEENLKLYDKLYIFKQSKYLGHPSRLIYNYYKKDVEEYGPGFINREQRPFFKETLYMKPDFTCYNNMLTFSAKNPRHPIAWKLRKAITAKQKQQVRLYEIVEGEYLRRDFPENYKRLVVHDDPNILFNDKKQTELIDDLFKEGYKITFIQPLDISLLKDTNIIERVITDSKMATLRGNLMISSYNDSSLFFVKYFITHKCKEANVLVLFDKGKTDDYYFRTMLELNYYNNKTHYTLRMRPYWDKEIVTHSPLTRCMYRFLYKTPYLMSFYEFVFYTSCKNLKVPERLINTNEETYGFILSKYGMDELLMELEDWLLRNPSYEAHVFIGGSSDYKKERLKAYNARKHKYAFDISQEGGNYNEK